MRLQWVLVGISALLLSGCVVDKPNTNKQPAPLPNVPAQRVLGAEPRYEPYHPTANQDYRKNGVIYRIVTDPANFSERGEAIVYDSLAMSRLTTIGERVNPYEFAAAHPTLPIPSYVKITNLLNGRTMVVRINDRGPYVNGKQIQVTPAVSDSLRLMPTTPLLIEGIVVDQTGHMSGIGTHGAQIEKKTTALPERPNFNAQPAAPAPLTTSTPTNNNMPVESPAPTPVPAKTPTPVLVPTPAETETKASKPVLSANSIAQGFYVQVSALSNENNAQFLLNDLSSLFNTQGVINKTDGLYKVQLGPYSSKEQAETIKNKLKQVKNITGFIITQ
ncbi:MULTISPECIES: endolytic peptidoglycan transglycosylase RlpA [Proteus]|uniref:endolytic peptidoglycan transglycosylase RlpA n=1 Tax=Proteus TaxID=583 RepID=UPI000E00D916|nr:MULTISPECIES: endolytic peptidoglycan transglycosylase RlpA [Proteus]MCX2586594.1 endolytic peptidoglycan transglycosylase RlpA [Proteus penneri]NBL77892.1 endolytic peptidoglycan transglycosylase RlpA [Proteus sp. G2672]NBM03571.1 endolytic peptidoglycan transglycosylase RlpA [Proteus sp. G2671]NBM59272.1 endolytic peptidoglycan transglycosylase RlpA [Proteus sp. G2667]NBM70183.1 endolytic peptidoglycan transglycosylase RlpA [Proteus sp. G2663]